MNAAIATVVIGIGATAVIDAWAIVRRKVFAIPAPNYALVGRWLGHMPRGRFHHEAIAGAAPVAGEFAIGWIAHYLIGVMYAAVLVAVAGPAWLRHPTPGPALLVGIATVAAPFLLMQPGMGAGIAARRTPNPPAARWQSLLMHAIFGFGLYVVAFLLARATG